MTGVSYGNLNKKRKPDREKLEFVSETSRLVGVGTACRRYQVGAVEPGQTAFLPKKYETTENPWVVDRSWRTAS